MELTPELQEKKIFLIEGLKRTYKKQYDVIQPLPYIKDRLYCVDKVFVEGGIEVCLAPELARGTGGSWERLESYKSVYTDFRFKSKRRIIQGEPGYGKSTLTLQLAYDWCNDVSDSPINNVEILILLRLRQLGSVKSLFRAIKSFLLFREPRVSKHEIEKIIHSCSSVHITLDGYDEYPGRNSNENDYVHRIINMELFADFDVSLTTRYLPESLRQETKRAKLTGFDDKARDEYIRKAVVGNNDEAVEKIKQRLLENSILADLCQVPLIFVMFAHMAHDERDVIKFKSVTQFFKHTIRCFYDHLKRKRKLYDDRNNRFYLHEMEHHQLDKIAFEGLNKKNQQLSWIKTEFRQRVGLASYDQYIITGILVEEDVVSDDSTGDNVLFTKEVHFYHKLFCEWYAAHHLVTLVKNAHNLSDMLRFLDPFDLQYLFRFACGLDPEAGKKLINHLKRLPGGDTFAILCILEQTGDVNEIMDSVKELCSRDVKIKRGDSALLQRSTTQLLEIASNNDIPISCLHLEYSSIKFEGDTIILHSRIPLPILPTVEKIHIDGSNEQYDNTGTVTDNNILNLFRYGMKCRRVKELMFSQLQLPASISPEAITNIMKTRNIQVRWRPFDIDFHLDLQNGHWEVDDFEAIRDSFSHTFSINDSDTGLQQRSKVQLLYIAANHDTPISCVHVNNCVQRFGEESFLLQSQVRLEPVTTVQHICIEKRMGFKEMWEIRNTDMKNIFHFGMKCQQLKDISFRSCMLPVDNLSNYIPSEMKGRDLRVTWPEGGYRLNLQTGDWEVADLDPIRSLCAKTVQINFRDSEPLQRYTIRLLENAAKYGIPITCLYLKKSFSNIDAGNIILKSELRLSCPVSVKKVVIDTEKGREMTETEVVDILVFVQQSHMLEELAFEGCRLPVSVSRSSFPKTMISRAINVSWCPFDSVFHLDLQTGLWEVDDFEAIRDSFSQTFSINDSDTGLQQRSKVQLLYIAANHDTPISCVHVNKCVERYEEDAFVLQSGVRLALLTTVQHICIEKGMGTKKMKKIRNTEMKNILHFGMKCQHLKDISFHSCMLSLDNLSNYIPSHMKGRNIRVTWPEGGYCLNLQTGDWEVADLDPIRALCTKTVQINLRDSQALQRDTIRLLENAAKYDIPIPCLYLKESFSKIDDGIVILHSRLRLSCPATVKKVVIHTEKGREMTETEVVDIFMFVQQSHLLKELKFDGCVLPLTFSSKSIPAKLQSRNIKVFWSNYGYSLDLQSGIWKVHDMDTVRELCTKDVDICRKDSELLQRCTIQLLENASNYDVPIPCLYLKESFSKIDDGIVILHSGLCLPWPVLVKKVVIQTEKGREMKETEFVDILIYVQQSHILEELEFDGCVLPLTFSSESIPAELQSRNIKVFWSNYGYSLDLQSCVWKVNGDVVRKLCTQRKYIQRDDSELLQRCTIQFLENASNYHIPISYLYLCKSYCKIDAGTLILHSGIPLSCPVSVKDLVIDTEEGREMTETEVVNILMFVQQSHMLEELMFFYCLLPQSIPAESIPSTLKSRNVKVSLGPGGRLSYTLNLQSGRWMRHGARQEIADTQYNDTVTWFRDEYKDTEWQKARISSGK